MQLKNGSKYSRSITFVIVWRWLYFHKDRRHCYICILQSSWL